MHKKIIFSLFLLIFSQLLQAEVTVRVDRNPVVVDESFQLIFKSDQKINTEPDFSRLNNNFTVLSSGRRSNTQINNGKVIRSQEWILTVVANKTGVIGIPPIRIGKEVSKPYSIKVVDKAPSQQGDFKGDIFIDVEVDTKSPYVQAQLIYTIKLYRAVQTNNASLSEPQISGGQAIINKLGDDTSFETKRNGKRYSVIQRRYAIFPQSSGALKIGPITFQGQVGGSSFFNFDPFGPQPRSVVKRSGSIQIDVKSIPDSFTGDTWLPASQLTIQEQWSVDPGKLKQGEATTRTLTLKANGLAASHLPTIKNNLPDNLKQYPDQPEFEETNDVKGFIGIRRDKMAIIPTEGGDYTLPNIKIPWWNTATDKMEFAELPERSIHVDASVVEPVENTVSEQVMTNQTTVSEPEISDQDNKTPLASSNEQPVWKWISLLLFLLWLLTLFIFWRARHNDSISNIKKEEKISNRKYLKKIQQACNNNDPNLSKQALLEWANSHWPDKKINNLNMLKDYCDEAFSKKLDELNSCLYGKSTSSWDGAGFLRCFESQSFKNNKPIDVTGKLEPLYKT